MPAFKPESFMSLDSLHLESLIVVAAVAAAFTLSATQSLIASRAGSDHPVHAFLRDGIRANHGRLFITVPRLLNTAHCAALPLYLHWIMARLPVGAIRWSERLLNPAINALHAWIVALLAALAAASAGLPPEFAGGVAMAFALTPQFFHALSARNFGLSARGTGLVLLSVFFAVTYLAGTASPAWALWVAAVLLGWLIWGFSTFAQQALLVMSMFLLLTGIWQPAAGTIGGLAVFIALHPKYATSYLRHTARFLRAYARELSPIYVLQRRPSIWRDLRLDIWLKFVEIGTTKAVLYAYENSAIVVALLNPLTIPAAWKFALDRTALDWFGYSAAVAAAGLASALVTSVRPLRFLGEPERYVEVATPWSTLCVIGLLHGRFGPGAIIALCVAFALVNVAQLGASWKLMRHVTRTNDELDVVGAIVDRTFGTDARFCSNNEQLTKLLMGHPWRFAYFIAVGQEYAGMTATQAFTRFPFLRPQACERVVREYGVNALLLDRQVFEDLSPALLPSLASSTVLYESPRFRLLRLDWRSAPRP